MLQSPTSSRSLARAAERIEAVCDERPRTQQLIERVGAEIRAAVCADALFIAATDPDTMLAYGAGMAWGLPDTVCAPFWALEFEVPDYNKFSDLARSRTQVADLHAATGGRPERSARWRELRSLMDVGAELRATFNAGGRSWGLLHAGRADTRGGFDAGEIAFMETVAPAVGRALRASLVSDPADPAVGRGPGMLILDAGAQIVSATSEAVEWLGELQSVRHVTDARLGVPVPSEVFIAAHEARARAAALDGCIEATRMRARTRGGAWLLIHASALRGPDGAIGDTAVVIEPAKASEVAPLIVEAYGLTPREVEVTCAAARGLTTPEIAKRLHLSRYTVQDHLKAVYEKVGVSSRGELVAKMFADHYHDGLKAAVGTAVAAAA